jgi:hypothetical protein
MTQQEWTVGEAQRDMRQAYLRGGPGVLVSGSVWLAAGAVALAATAQQAVLTLFIGAMAIHPIGTLLCRLLGRPGAHMRGNPLAPLAMENTLWLLFGCALAYGLSLWRSELFFPAMLLMIGGRYLTFATLYGMRVYWVLAALLAGGGMLLAQAGAAMAVGAFAGGVIEIGFGLAICFAGYGAARDTASVHTSPS